MLSAVVTGMSLSSSSEAATWRSESGQTRIPNLDSICWGDDFLGSVRTVFGGGSYSGTISMDQVQTRGCNPGDTLTGQFHLYNNQNHCQGRFTVTWKPNNRAFLEWDITNLGQCPINHSHWEITTYPVSAVSDRNPGVSSQGVATVFDPPSNVRATPNGQIICSVRQVITIDLYGSSQNSWYQTDVCGEMGYIHDSQIRF